MGTTEKQGQQGGQGQRQRQQPGGTSTQGKPKRESHVRASVPFRADRHNPQTPPLRAFDDANEHEQSAVGSG